jgi:acetylserotonin N-methyltransferase
MALGALPASTDDRVMWDLWQSVFTLPLVTVADEVGTFGALSVEPMTTEGLARKLAVDARALGMHLAGLAALGLVDRRGGKWTASTDARRWLHPEAEGYWGGFLSGFRERTVMHAQLLETLKTGKRPTAAISGGPEWERGHMSAQTATRIAAFMHSHSQAPARGAAQQPEFASVRHLMDIGCGSGVYGIEIARTHPDMLVTLMDLEAMCGAAQTYVDKAGLADRINMVAVNMFEEEWPAEADAHFFANVFHDWSEETNRLLARKSFEALPSGGRIFLSEVLMDDDLDGPWHAASFSLLMLVGTLGKQYSLLEFTEILESAGFTGVAARRYEGSYYSLVSATKP